MATISERAKSPVIIGGDNPSIEVSYNILNESNYTTAYQTFLASLSATLTHPNGATLYLQDPRMSRLGDKSDTDWIGTAKYGIGSRYDTGESEYNFDTGGNTVNRKYSRETIKRWDSLGVASTPDFKNAVNYDGEKVGGVDVVVPAYKWNETHYLSLAFVTTAWRLRMADMTGMVNNSAFRGFAAGEVLFLGVSGKLRGREDWQMKFSFSASPNIESFTIGDITAEGSGGSGSSSDRIEGGAKDGWDYLWVYFEDVKSGDSLVQVPKLASVERIYDRADFSEIGIGVGDI